MWNVEKKKMSTQWMRARVLVDKKNRLTVITNNNTINLMLTSIKFSDFIKFAKKSRKIQ